MRVNVEDVVRITKLRKAINSLPFKSIDWYKDGKKLQVSKEDKDEFHFTGLSNCDFIDEEGNPMVIVVEQE